MADTVTLCYQVLDILLGSTDYSTWRTFGPSAASSLNIVAEMVIGDVLFVGSTKILPSFRTIYTSTMWLDSWTKNEMDLGFLVYKYAVRLGLSSKSFCDLITDMGSHGRTECSTTESSDDIEKQELEEVSDEDELSFFDTKEYFTEPNISCGSVQVVNNTNKINK
ncbi:uncharacterized protein LOC133727944 [Rosa rugosa]|uniref:uncharacterized protein LOC133727944 n=1 Tax=Rosa rugosa TaxID=74645 RepID=UPI002B4084F1|nr:uncharacterized protein LOC133727944 [Rosa rugosa]